MITIAKKKWIEIALFFAVAVWFTLLAAKPIDLISQDLGRHLTNGKWLFSPYKILTTNAYSYTEPSYPFINHHWGSGVVFYYVHSLFGFLGLSVLVLLINITTLFLLLKECLKRGASAWAVIAAMILCVPLIAYRPEVRPEVFSGLLCAMFFVFLSDWARDRRSKKIFLLPLLMAIWINLHIYFVLGFLILGVFWVRAFLESRQKPIPELPSLRPLSIVAVACVLGTFVNPIGYKLVLFPSNLLFNYGYRVLENQSVFFLLSFGIRSLAFYIFYLTIGVWIISLAAAYVSAKKLPPWEILALSIGVLAMSLFAVRYISLAAIFLIPCLAWSFQKIYDRWVHSRAGRVAFLCIFGSGAFFAAYITWLSLQAAPFGLGLAPRAEESAEFFKKNNIAGPVFNNYDIGGYLIYNLWPDSSVFVDNRPEAYSEELFRHYMEIQLDKRKWEKAEDSYSFNAVFFAWHDLTEWGQAFLIRITQDPNWEPVYIDPYAIILLKKNEANREVIDKYRLSRSIFTARPAQ